MTIDDATLEETSEVRWARQITDYFALSDRWEFASFGDYLSRDIEFRFANNAPIKGLDAMLEFAALHKDAVKSVRHTLNSFYTDLAQRTVVVELRVRYVQLDDTTSEYPAAVVLTFNTDDLIKGYRVYVDLSALG
ncbi:nuclear transport factor 2 family protein [Mycobacterium sp.]|uniref:nuclear transport factor 2 family protein n=1 Tax=Mycobacterium sp. TaxID=1785 RepID=UPI003D0F15E0